LDLAISLFALLFKLLDLFSGAIILAAVVSTLLSFGVLDSRNRFVWTVSDFLYRVTEPLLRPIRNTIPSFGGIDLTPLIALLLIQYVISPLLRTIEVNTINAAFG
jgi:YggT family protein